MTEEQIGKWTRLQEKLRQEGIDGAVITSNVNLFYFTGKIVNGYFYVPAEGSPKLFVRTPLELEGEHIVYIRNVRELPKKFAQAGFRRNACCWRTGISALENT